MYDIHTHIMPGVDDGASGLTETLHMLQLAESGGTKGLILTPHCNIPRLYTNYYDTYFRQFLSMLRTLMTQKNSSLRIYMGQEVFLEGPFLRLLREGKLIPLNNSSYILCELDPFIPASEAILRLDALRAEGCIPILAHPERYAFVQEDPQAALQLKAMGILLQINKDSLKGTFGEAAAHTAHLLLSWRKADFIASDAHSLHQRTPYLKRAYEAVCELYTPEYTRFLLCENPLYVIQNRRIHSF